MTAQALFTIYGADDGQFKYDIAVDHISRSGEVDKAVKDLLVEQITVANLMKQLKEDLPRTTKESIQSKSYQGKRMETIYTLHRDLAKLECACASGKDRVFTRVTVYETSAGLLSNTYRIEAAYTCPDCGDSYSADGVFSINRIMRMFGKG